MDKWLRFVATGYHSSHHPANDNNNNNNIKHICIVPYGRNFRGTVARECASESERREESKPGIYRRVSAS